MTDSDPEPILPGAVIGLMGGGQLGRMTALAARALGYRVHVLDPDPACAARGVCDHFVHAALDDATAAAELGSGARVVTCEREDVGVASLRALERESQLRPGARVLEILQDRGLQKQWLASRGFPTGPFRVLDAAVDLTTTADELGGALLLKSRRGGFDGRSQWRVGPGQPPGVEEPPLPVGVIAELELPLQAELSVLVARSPNGAIAIFPAARNFCAEGMLSTSVIPANLEPALVERAAAMAERIAVELDVVGLLAVELFWTQRGELLVNELAARPHNTFHATELACATSQFEQLVRAVCGLPLGDTRVFRPTAIGNVLGDVWLQGKVERMVELLHAPGLHLRLYGKAPRAHRKLGHLACTADTPEQALQNVDRALQSLHDAPAGPVRAR